MMQSYVPILINIDTIMQTNILKLMQRGGRLIAATPRGAEEDDQPDSGDEHIKLFEVRIRSMFFVLFIFAVVCFCCCLFSLLFVFYKPIHYAFTGSPSTKPRRRSETWKRIMPY